MPRRPTALHGVAATADAACFFPDHRLSNSGPLSAGAPGAGRLVMVHRAPPMGETRTPHLAHGAGGACRTAPIRWWRAMRYGASPRNPDPAPLCPASSDRYPNPLVLLNVTSAHGCFRSIHWLIRDQRVLRAASTDHCAPIPIEPIDAHERPASRWSPACRERSIWTCVSAVMGSSVRMIRCVGCSSDSGNEKIAPPMIARPELPSGLGQRTRQWRGASTREHRDATPRASSVARTGRTCQGAITNADEPRDARAYFSESIVPVYVMDWFICISPIAPLAFTGPSIFPSRRRAISRPVAGAKTK